MQYNNEAALKEALGIESWRNLSKGKLVDFIAMMPQVDRKVALAVIGQFPRFTDLARAVLEDTARAYESAIDANECNQARMHESRLRILAILEAELNKDLLPEERLRVLDDIRDMNDKACANDAENKRFVGSLNDKKLLFGLGVVILALGFIGVQVRIKAGDSA
ncbi:MAG: hypothetical protein R2722_06045 [Tessaracoccus sp.]